MKKKLTLFLLAMMCTIGTWADNVCKNTATDTEYATIQAAVDAVATGQTIQVISDVSITSTITITSSIPAFTLDLNGHVLSRNTSNWMGDNKNLITNDGILTIIDSNPTTTHTGDLAAYKGGILTGGNGRLRSIIGGYQGGAIYSNGTLTINGCTITGNSANAEGGAICTGYGSNRLTLNGTTICNNSANRGAGIWASRSSLKLTNAKIEYNTADGEDSQGGGIRIIECYDAIIEGCTISHNQADYGSAICTPDSARTVSFKNCEISYNKGSMGTVYINNNNSGGPYTFDGCIITNNESGMIAGIYSSVSTVIKNTTVSGNSASMMVGGFAVPNTITLEGKVVIKDNKSGAEGSYINDNLCALAPVTIGEGGLSAGSEIGVYNMVMGEEGPEGYCGGQFTTNGSASDLQYFISDQADYYTHYNTTDSYLELLEGRTFSDASVTKEQLTAAKTAGTATNVTIARTFYKDGYYNSLCLPFSLSATELAASPFAGYKALKKFVSATVEGSTLNIVMEDATSIEAGVPYMISWDAAAENIVNPVFESVTITEDEAGKIQHDNADCDGTFIPTTLEKDNQNLLFLGANNTLYWPNTTNPLKGFRCYFEVKPASGAKHGMPAMFADDSAAGISQMENGKWRIENVKFIENGKVVIMNNGVRYNAAGQQIR